MRHGVWKWFLLVALIVGVMAMGTAQAAAPYADGQGRFAFTMPDGYVQEMSPQVPTGVSTANFSSPGLPGARFNVTTVDDPSNAQASLDDLTGQTLQELSQAFPDITLWTQGIVNAKVGSADAREYVFRGTVPNTQSRVRGAMLVALKGTTAYTILFSANDGDFDKMADQCTPVLATFAFTGEQPAAAGAGNVPTGPTATPKNIITGGG